MLRMMVCALINGVLRHSAVTPDDDDEKIIQGLNELAEELDVTEECTTALEALQRSEAEDEW